MDPSTLPIPRRGGCWVLPAPPWAVHPSWVRGQSVTCGAGLGVGRVRLRSLARVLSTGAGPSSAAGVCGQERAGPGARQGWQPAGVPGRLRALRGVGTTLELVRGDGGTGQGQDFCHSLAVMSHPQHVTMLGVPGEWLLPKQQPGCWGPQPGGQGMSRR